MRVKTSITLPEEILHALDRVGGRGTNRSKLIEQAIAFFLAARARDARDARDREILDREADALNAEVTDALRFQVDL